MRSTKRVGARAWALYAARREGSFGGLVEIRFRLVAPVELPLIAVGGRGVDLVSVSILVAEHFGFSLGGSRNIEGRVVLDDYRRFAVTADDVIGFKAASAADLDARRSAPNFLSNLGGLEDPAERILEPIAFKAADCSGVAVSSM
jgi:hypothetical protein